MKDKSDAYGYCPYCRAPLKRNRHAAESKSGAIVFPALIIATICIVIFIYIEQVWPIILGVSIVLVSLIYDHIITQRRIPKDWRKWKIVSTRDTAEHWDLRAPIIPITIGVLWVLIALLLIVLAWPTLSWPGVINFILGFLWIMLGIININKRASRKK